MSNGFQGYQGYGSNLSPEMQRQLMQGDNSQLAGELASLPDTELGYDWLNAPMPQGQMISGRFVAPSMTQMMANAAKRGLGGMMVKRRGDAAKALAEELERRTKPTLSPHEF